jgi:hypothetical protein
VVWRKASSEPTIVANIDLDEFKETKGILVQAKMLEIGEAIEPGEWARLLEQVNKMLEHTSDSYVWIYSEQGVDPHLAATDRKSLRALKAEYGAKNAVLFSARRKG